MGLVREVQKLADLLVGGFGARAQHVNRLAARRRQRGEDFCGYPISEFCCGAPACTLGLARVDKGHGNIYTIKTVSPRAAGARTGKFDTKIYENHFVSNYIYNIEKLYNVYFKFR